MTRLTILVLVLLRLAVGWHLGYEGYTKLRKGDFTSEEYLRESSGPLAGVFRSMAGDPLAERLTPKEVEPNVDPTKESPAELFPPALEKEWDAWFGKFANHYELDDNQLKVAANKLEQEKAAFVDWLRTYRKNVETTSPYGPPVVKEQSIAERIDSSRAKLKELREYLADEYRKAEGTLFEDDAKVKVATLRRDLNAIRADLRKDLEQRNSEMRQNVASSVLLPEHWEKEPPSTSVKPAFPDRGLLGWIDTIVPWGLLILGGFLMLGLFTRTSAVLAALLILSFYLAMPPLPGSPVPPNAEGNYLVINKNVIEILALLVLATTQSGQWFGLDGIILAAAECCFGRRKPAAAAPGATPRVMAGSPRAT